MINKKMIVTLLSAAVLLTACGESKTDRAISGAAIGAGVGAAGAAVAGSNPLGGAAIGAGVGGVAGAATDSSQIDLGKPVWK